MTLTAEGLTCGWLKKNNQAGVKPSDTFKPWVFTCKMASNCPYMKFLSSCNKIVHISIVHISNFSLHATRCRILGGRRILQPLKGGKPPMKRQFYQSKWSFLMLQLRREMRHTSTVTEAAREICKAVSSKLFRNSHRSSFYMPRTPRIPVYTITTSI